jgi:hypothetical protein
LSLQAHWKSNSEDPALAFLRIEANLATQEPAQRLDDGEIETGTGAGNVVRGGAPVDDLAS